MRSSQEATILRMSSLPGLFLEGCWLRLCSSLPQLSKGAARDEASGFSRVRDPKARKSDKEGSCHVFQNPGSRTRQAREGLTGGGVAGPLGGRLQRTEVLRHRLIPSTRLPQGLRDNTILFPQLRPRKLRPGEVEWAGQGQTKTWTWAGCMLWHFNLAAAYFIY